MKRGEFILDGISSVDHGVLIQNRPVLYAPKRKVEFKSSFGMSGDYPFDEEAYENTEMELRLVMVGTTDRSASYNRDFVQDWFDSGSYQDLVAYFDPDKIYHVMPSESTEFVNKYYLGETQVAVMKLTVLPYKHLVEGKTFKISSGVAFQNPTRKTALPLIKVTGSGNITLTVNGKPFQLSLVDGHIYLDSEFNIAYKDNAGLATNANNKVKTLEYPFLKPGSNVISWTGSVTSVDITPRWRVLV